MGGTNGACNGRACGSDWRRRRSASWGEENCENTRMSDNYGGSNAARLICKKPCGDVDDQSSCEDHPECIWIVDIVSRCLSKFVVYNALYASGAFSEYPLDGANASV